MFLVDSWVSFNFAFYQNVTSINIESVTKQSLKYLSHYRIWYLNSIHVCLHVSFFREDFEVLTSCDVYDRGSTLTRAHNISGQASVVPLVI